MPFIRIKTLFPCRPFRSMLLSRSLFLNMP